MPLHDFRCTQCSHTFERLIRSSTTEVLCPSCGSAQVDKLLSAPQAPGKTKGIIAAARRQAKAEGHFSNYSAADRARIK